MPDDEARSTADAFWTDLADVVQACRESSGRDREKAWSALRDKLHDWTRAFVHRKGVRNNEAKDEFCGFMLTWLAGRGRLSSFHAERGHFFTWYSRALAMGYRDWLREERSIVSPGDEESALVEVAAPDGVYSSIPEARDELFRLPLALRTAFKVIHHSLLGPLEGSEVSEFRRLFDADYGEVRGRLDCLESVEVARILGKSSDWAYQVRSRVLKRLRESRDAR